MCLYVCTTGELPPLHEDFDDNSGVKVVTEYKMNDDGKKVKVSSLFCGTAPVNGIQLGCIYTLYLRKCPLFEYLFGRVE